MFGETKRDQSDRNSPLQDPVLVFRELYVLTQFTSLMPDVTSHSSRILARRLRSTGEYQVLGYLLGEKGSSSSSIEMPVEYPLPVCWDSYPLSIAVGTVTSAIPNRVQYMQYVDVQAV